MKKLINSMVATLIMLMIATTTTCFAIDLETQNAVFIKNYLGIIETIQNYKLAQNIPKTMKLGEFVSLRTDKNKDLLFSSSDEWVVVWDEKTKTLFARNPGTIKFIVSGDYECEYGITVESESASIENARLTNKKALTEENVLEAIYVFKDEYPDGMKWAI